ncbi:hypothetical protein [Bacillus sp. FJAT-27445]|uniref:hypothetical protein n=1 Tax=Bacillus sp. FJAT-27445 TaxID=1679166 RepID=UPI0007435243|nr:hypothetical protein [Bacillus sp. FJAT-27445]
MKKIFLNDVQSDQDVLVFDSYQILKSVKVLEDYPFNSFGPQCLPSDRRQSINFWKNHLKGQFIGNKNFHSDLLFRSSKASLKRWSDYKKIPLSELLIILKKNTELEIDNRFQNDSSYEMKLKSLFNEHLVLAVTPEAITNPAKTYKLKDANSLYTELAKLEVFDIKSIIGFSKHFGIPSGIMDDTGIDLYLESDCLFFPFSSISLLNKQIAIYKQDFEWFKNIQTSDVSGVKSLLGKTDLCLIEDLNNDQTVINLAKNHLAMRLRRTDAFNVSLRVAYQDGSFVPGVWFSNLFAYAYFQIARALSNEVKVRECENCGHIFEVTHERQRFCPPLPLRKRSSCEMAYNNRLKKERKNRGEN